MNWLVLDFHLVSMSITIPPSKLGDITTLVSEWKIQAHAKLQFLRVLHAKLLNVTQWCSMVRYFLNCMLDTLRACPTTDSPILPQN